MEPNEALSALRQLVVDMQGWTESGEDPDEPGEYYRIASEATEGFDNLDEWVTKGGFLPRAWTPALLDLDRNEERAVRRLETAFDRALRDDEPLDRAFLKDGEEIHHLRDRLIQLLARTAVQEVQQERQAVERMLSSTVTRVFLDNLRTALEGP